MSGFGGLVPATLRYSTLEARRNLRRPAMMESSAHGYLSSQENSGHDGAASFGRSPVAHVLELLAALEPIARLLHALQCERGHTSCWVASRGAHDRDQPTPFTARQVHVEISSFPICAATSTFSAFTSLKEVYGRIRACIGGALVLDDFAFATVHAKLKGDLVISFHRRRAYARVIRHKAPRSLLRLISAGFEHSRALDEVLHRLESECNLQALRGSLTPRQWWAIITSHIDTLERVQRAMLGECEQTARRRLERGREGVGREGVGSRRSSWAGGFNAIERIVTPESPLSPFPHVGSGAGNASERRSNASPTPLRHSQVSRPAWGTEGRGAEVHGAEVSLFAPPRLDSYTRLFALTGVVAVSPREGASEADATAWALLNVASLLTLGRSGVHTSVGGAHELAERVRGLPAEALKEALCRLVDERAERGGSSGGDASASPLASPVASPVATRRAHLGGRAVAAPGAARGSEAGRQGGDPSHARLSIGSAPPDKKSELGVPAEGNWAIGLREILFEHRIGVGGAGATYAAQWNGAQVAVKVAGGVGSCKWLDSWRAEVAALTQLRHPNVVEYLGCVAEPPTYCLVLEYCPGGDLYEVLRRPTSAGLTMRVARGVAAGMAYLHSRSYIHRDLKSSNVLLDGAGAAKLMDFGLSRRLGDGVDEENLTAETGTYRWMAPEVIRHEPYTTSADVFSYGMLIFELLTHEVPYSDRPPLQAAVSTGLQGQRPPLPDGTPAAISKLIARCWETPTLRPTFASLVVELGEIARALSAEEVRWLDEPLGHKVTYVAGAPAVQPFQPDGEPVLPPFVVRRHSWGVDGWGVDGTSPESTFDEQVVWSVPVSSDSHTR